MVFRLDDLPADEILAALTTHPKDLLDEERFAVNDFITRIGGRDNAILAARMLSTLEAEPN